MYISDNIQNYVFCHRNGELRMAKANPFKPETWPYKREEIMQVFAECTADFLSVESNTYIQNRILELQDYINHHFHKSLTKNFGMEMTGMSKSNFYRHFKLKTGMPFTAYLNKVRLEQAARLLIETNLTVETVACDCGYDTLSNFYECFRKRFGVSPARFRVMGVTGL